MSIVIAIKKDGKVYMGADTQWSAGDSKGKGSKIWRVTPDIVIGSVGSLREGQIARFNDVLDASDIVNNKIDMRYLVNHFKNNLLDLIKKVDKPDAKELENNYLVGVKDKVYYVFWDGSVISLDEMGRDFLAIGSGEDHANAILNSNGHKEPEERIKEAIKTAETFTRSVNDDFEIFEVILDFNN